MTAAPSLYSVHVALAADAFAQELDRLITRLSPRPRELWVGYIGSPFPYAVMDGLHADETQTYARSLDEAEAWARRQLREDPFASFDEDSLVACRVGNEGHSVKVGLRVVSGHDPSPGRNAPPTGAPVSAAPGGTRA